ncbi:hypothetical protein MWU50_09015 [Flavobacteriaceae bacterium S0862]|nr:hypothetical protein [Flavobacteriaceae bacterium S0862]
MKNYSFILLLIAITIVTSCDGRDRALESNKERVSRSNVSIDAIEVVKFVPEQYLKTVTDTLLDSKTNIQVSYYSSSNKSVIIANNEHNETHYREFESEIKVFKNDKLLFEDIISKSNFITNEQNFWKNAVLQYVWLDDFESSDDNYKLFCSFLVPESEKYKMYSIHFNNSGEKTIKLIETS